MAESCDNRDNDCDGSTDNGLSRSCGVDTGDCQRGTQTCRQGNYGSCVGEIVATSESCDRRDNDCDGNIDDGSNLCGAGSVCRNGSCVSTCTPSSITIDGCPQHLGFTCDGFSYDRSADACGGFTSCWVGWKDRSGFTTNAHDGNFISRLSTSAVRAKDAWWRFVSFDKGDYQLAVRIPDPPEVDPTGTSGDCEDRWRWTKKATYRVIVDGVEVAQRVVDQEANQGAWVNLVTVFANSSIEIRVSNATGEGGCGSARVITVDAARITRVCP